MKEVYVVKTYNDISKKLETLFFEVSIDAFVFLEKRGYSFHKETENYFTFDRTINGIREWAVVERKSVIPKQPIPFKFGDKIKFKQYAIDSGTFPNSIKEGFTATVMDVTEENVLLHVGSGLNIAHVVPIEDMHERWFELVSSAEPFETIYTNEKGEINMNKIFIGCDMYGYAIYEGDSVTVTKLDDALNNNGEYKIGDTFIATKKGEGGVYWEGKTFSLKPWWCKVVSEQHIMVDIETLGTSTDATIFQIAAVNFGIKTGEIYSEFNEIQEIGELGSMNISGRTLQWWLENDPTLLSELISNPTTSNLLEKFHTWLSSQGDKSSRYMWGNGILFDNNIIRHQLVSAGLDYPINYDKDRDVRTILQLASDKLSITVEELKNMTQDHSLIAHNAINDVYNQIYSVVFAYNTIMGNSDE